MLTLKGADHRAAGHPAERAAVPCFVLRILRRHLVEGHPLLQLPHRFQALTRVTSTPIRPAAHNIKVAKSHKNSYVT